MSKYKIIREYKFVSLNKNEGLSGSKFEYNYLIRLNKHKQLFI